MRGNRRSSDGADQGDLFAPSAAVMRGFDLADLPSLELEQTSDPVELLEQIAARATDLASLIRDARDAVADAGGDASLATAVAVVDACGRIESLANGQGHAAVMLANASSHELLEDEDAEPGAPRASVDGDRYVRRGLLTASAIGPALGIGPGTAQDRVRAAHRLMGLMPYARQRLADGDWTSFHLRLALNAVTHLDDETIREIDAALHGDHARVSAPKVAERIDAWLANRALPTHLEPKRLAGMDSRCVWYGQIDMFGMQKMGAYLPAVEVAAIRTAINTIASTAEPDDPRTRSQIEADVFRTFHFGPATLAPSVAGQLGLLPPWVDENGYGQCDAQQAMQTARAWDGIAMLAATLGLTFCRPPQAHINVTVGLQTLLELGVGLTPGHPDNQPDPTRAGTAREPRPPGIPPDDASARTPRSPDVPTIEGLRPLGGLPGSSGSLPDRRSELSESPPTGPPPGAEPCPEPGVESADPSHSTAPEVARSALPSNERDSRAQVAGVGAISHDLLHTLVNYNSYLRRVITNDITHQPLNFGRKRYVPSPAMAGRVRERDRHCRFPFCTRPAIAQNGSSADLDHVIEHRADGTGGETADSNLAVLCRAHHRIKHQSSWTPILHDDASMTWRNNHLGLDLVTVPGNRA